MPTYSGRVSSALAGADARQFSPGELQVADLIVRAILYPTEEVSRIQGAEIRVVLKWPGAYTELLRDQFRSKVRLLALEELPAYVAQFVSERFVNPHFAPLFDPIQQLLLRYAIVEQHDSGMYLTPARQEDQEQGYTLHTKLERKAGDLLSAVTAQIPWESSTGHRWKGWAEADVPRFLLGPLRFAPFTCCPPRPCCQPNAKLVYPSQNRPLAATLVALRDIAPDERIVVEWSDMYLLLSSSPLACNVE